MSVTLKVNSIDDLHKIKKSVGMHKNFTFVDTKLNIFGFDELVEKLQIEISKNLIVQKNLKLVTESKIINLEVFIVNELLMF